MKTEKVQGQERILAEHLDRRATFVIFVIEGATFVILINHANAPIRKERLSPTSKATREAGRNKFLEKSGCQAESKAFEKAIVARIVRKPGLDLFNPFKMD